MTCFSSPFLPLSYLSDPLVLVQCSLCFMLMSIHVCCIFQKIARTDHQAPCDGFLHMGCVLSNGSTRGSPRHELERLKLENGYAKVGHVRARQSTGVRQEPPKGMKHEVRYGVGDHVTAGRQSFGQKEDRIAAKHARRSASSKTGDENGKGIDRAADFNHTEEYELVDGWPKWLVDNIPRQVLRNIIPKSADSYVKIEKIGQGTYSNVYKARERRTGKIVALKKVRFETSEPESVKFMAREIMMLQKLDHPNIVKLEGIATSRMQYSLYLVFDYMQTDLAKILSRPDERLTEPQIKCYMQQLLLGLEHCHEHGILHRDIKGANLLIDRDGMLKIADFGLANFFDAERRRPLTNRVVTLWYRAPELLLGSTDYGVGIDLWSVGCLMAEMFAGRPILPGRTEVEQLHRIFKLCGTPSDEYYKRLRLSTDLKPPQMYKSILQEAFKRFPPSSFGLLSTLLALDPSHRGTAQSASQNEFFHTIPLACGLSGLPATHVEDDDEALIIDKRKYRTTKRRRQRKQNVDAEDKKSAATSTFSSVTESSTTSNSTASAKTREKSPPRLFPIPAAPSHAMSETNPDAAKNIKNRPPVLSTRKLVTNFSNIDAVDTNRLDLIQRSTSSREHRTQENIRRLEMLTRPR